MRILALDVGDRRIGVALSDQMAVIASPLTTIASKDEASDLSDIVRLIEENEVSEVVVGLPLSMSGRKGEQAKRTEKFSKALSRVVNVPVKLLDERLSSVQAEKMIRESGGRPSDDRARVDATAAAIILQAYLDSPRHRNA